MNACMCDAEESRGSEAATKSVQRKDNDVQQEHNDKRHKYDLISALKISCRDNGSIVNPIFLFKCKWRWRRMEKMKWKKQREMNCFLAWFFIKKPNLLFCEEFFNFETIKWIQLQSRQHFDLIKLVNPLSVSLTSFRCTSEMKIFYHNISHNTAHDKREILKMNFLIWIGLLNIYIVL